MSCLSKMIAVSMFAFSLLGGCTQVAEKIDCTKVCNRYQECFNSDYDVDKCVDRCSNNDDVNKAEKCESCIDDVSCVASFACVPECVGIVP